MDTKPKINPLKTCCFTGHRIIKSADMPILNKNLKKILSELISDGYDTFITGGALGFDTVAATQVLSFKQQYKHLRLILALPCKDQAARWNPSQIRLYNSIISRADEVIYTSENYTPGCMLSRNRFMVDNSSAVIVYLTRPSGGTAYTANYALDKNVRLINSLIQ